ncbi:hypothetical protein H8S33_16975 [Ornithinibacillus sp. BX22]|uniref:Uncharacterized protein n=1 Tax=Ornithinibacillus hominis TaxID=2763055 RepID=A0A923L8S6_9BACI|nr:hypothetical protein [Ornithinibacillus hominis]MBC5638471.1 hypothetical protein [Ornithinibacillus hominis]
MVIITYSLAGLYAVLTGVGAIAQWKEKGFQIQRCLFLLVSISMLFIMWIPNKTNVVISFVLAFVFLHVLAIIEGMKTQGRINWRHHMTRFAFHTLLTFLLIRNLL